MRRRFTKNLIVGSGILLGFALALVISRRGNSTHATGKVAPQTETARTQGAPNRRISTHPVRFSHDTGADPLVFTPAATVEPLDPGVRRQTYVHIDLPLSQIAAAIKAGDALTGFTLPVFDGRDLDVQITAHAPIGPDSGSFTGRIVDQPGSFVFLGYDGSAEAGTVQIPGEGYLLSITYAGEGILRLSELDPHQLPGCAPPLIPPVDG